MKCENEAQLFSLINWITGRYHTGSRAIGGYTESSDFDYVETEDRVKMFASSIGLDTKLVDANKYGEDGSMSLKYRRSECSNWINLIIVPNDTEYNAWQFATAHCETMYDKGYLRSKETRVQLFRTYKEIYREVHSR